MSTVEDIYRCTPRQMRRHVIRVLKKGRVPFVQSSPGLGKSQIMADIAKQFNLKLIDHRLSTSPPEDLTGLPRFTDNGMAVFAPFLDLFPLEGFSEVPEGYDGWLLFLDELNAAERPTQAAAYKLILDRMIGQHPLHKKCLVACAGNLATDKAIVNELSTAMQSRLIHINMIENFGEWYEDVAIARNYDQRIKAYMNYRKTELMNFDPDHTDRTFNCPRTWEFMNDLIKGEEVTDEDAPLFAGTITPGSAASFVAFTKVYDKLITVPQVLANPSGVPVPTDRATIFATITHLSEEVSEENFASLSTFVDRLGAEFRVVFYRTVMVKLPQLRHNPVYAKAMLELTQYLYVDAA
jgi:hypothetical protein